MRNWKLEKWNRFSIVFPPTGIVSPALVAVGAAAAAQVSLQIGSYTASSPNVAGPLTRATPTPTW